MFKYIKFNRVRDAFTEHRFVGQGAEVKVYAFDVDVVALSGEENAIDALIGGQDARIVCEEIVYEEFKYIVQATAQYARVKQRVEEKYNADVAVLTDLYPLHERETWTTQLQEANAYMVSNNETDAPFLKTIADAEGGTVADFANAVIVKSAAYQSFMAQKLAEKRAFEKELMQEIGL
jgi:hypothetical protein